MKTIFGALALVLAAPVMALSAPATDSHAQHGGMQHGAHRSTQPDGNTCKVKAKGPDGKMVCKDKPAPKAPASAPDHKAHQGHAH